MTQEDILEMAREAGFEQLGPEIEDWICYTHQIERFACLVAAAERKACAKMCDELANPSRSHRDPSRAWVTGTLDCVAAIRARGDA